MANRPSRSAGLGPSRPFVALSLGLMLVFSGCGGSTVFDAATGVSAETATSTAAATSTP